MVVYVFFVALQSSNSIILGCGVGGVDYMSLGPGTPQENVSCTEPMLAL